MGLVSQTVAIETGGRAIMTQGEKILKQLAEMECDQDTLIAGLAELLSKTPREQRHCLSLLVHQYVAQNAAGAEIMDALLEIDTRLVARGAPVPFATKLAPLVTVLIRHADRMLLTDGFEKKSADEAPVLHTGRRTIMTVPPLSLSPENFQYFADKLLREVRKRPIKKCQMYLNSGREMSDDVKSLLDLLIADLTAQNIQVVVTDGALNRRDSKRNR
jgi:hypothetical protein